jgi:pyridoxamine---pyruvate transaminase
MRFADFTLSAGPTASSGLTEAALGGPMCYHYDPAFLEQYRDTEDKLRQVFGTTQDILIMHGEAVLGLEAAWQAVVRPGMHCLNLVSGIFGKLYGDWLRMSEGVVHEIVVDWDDAIDPAEVDAYLEAHPEIEMVAVVYSETPSGTINRVDEIGPIAHKHGCITIVDCVSALGGMPFDPDAWQLDICVAGPQKCLSGPVGLSLMTVSRRAWEVIGENPTAPRYTFMSMLDWKEQWLEGGKFPFTPSISDVRGTLAACEQFLEEGHEHAFARHRLAAEACRAGVKAMGLRLWPRSEAIASSCSTSIALPDDLSDAQVRAHVRERYGVMISGSQGAGNLVRIGHMGETARSLYPVVGLAGLGRGLADLGVDVDVGAGVAAAMEVYSKASLGEAL